MNIEIRPYKNNDYPMIDNWWKQSGENSPDKELFPENTTFIMELNNEPIYCLSLYLTNCKEYSILTNFIGNPDLKLDRKKYAIILVDYLIKIAKELGYSRVVCTTKSEKLMNRYKNFGFYKTSDNLISMVREI